MGAPQRISKEMVIEAGLNVLKKKGFDAVSARSVAKEAGCSTQPVYQHFSNMEDLKSALKQAAAQLYIDTVQEYLDSGEYFPYASYGMGFVGFAKKEKQLFRYLYLEDGKRGKEVDDVTIPRILDLLHERFGWDEEICGRFHKEMTVFTLGLAVMANTGYTDLTEKEISKAFQIEFQSLCSLFGVTGEDESRILSANPASHRESIEQRENFLYDGEE